MEQVIEAPNDDDINLIAHQVVHAQQFVKERTGIDLTGKLNDLDAIQKTLDSQIDPGETYTLQALGIAFGKVFIENSSDYDWWMVQDEYGRDPAIRFSDTSILVFPQTMISKRVEDGELVNVREMFEGLRNRLEEFRVELGH